MKPSFKGFEKRFEKDARWLYNSLTKERDVELYNDGPVLRITMFQGMDMGWKTLFHLIGNAILCIGALDAFVEYGKTGSILKAALKFIPSLILYYLSTWVGKNSPYSKRLNPKI